MLMIMIMPMRNLSVLRTTFDEYCHDVKGLDAIKSNRLFDLSKIQWYHSFFLLMNFESSLVNTISKDKEKLKSGK